MHKSPKNRKIQVNRASCSLKLDLDQESKNFLTKAAELRRISVSDYVRVVIVPQARREVCAACEQVIVLSPEDQLSLWSALNETPKLTPAQKRLGKMMRGER
jgi:uncharacterized protein (DUF1778 family)